MSQVKVEFLMKESLRERCSKCQSKFVQRSLRIVLIDYSAHEAWLTGGEESCYHLECFVTVHPTLNLNIVPNGIFYTKEVPENLKNLLRNELLGKMIQETTSESVGSQNRRLFDRKEMIQGWSTSVLQKLLQHNRQYLPASKSEILKILSDAMEFGALEECPDCGGQLKYTKDVGYKCTNVLQWSDCLFVTSNPKRREFLIPEDLKADMEELSDYECKKGSRILAEDKSLFLKDLSFVILTNDETPKSYLKKKIHSLGGSLRSRLTANTTCLVSTKELLEKMNSEIQKAKDWSIPVVGEDFLNDVDTWDKGALELLLKKAISDWKCTKIDDLSRKMSQLQMSHSAPPVKPSQSARVVVKGAGVVPQQYTKDYHVYERGFEKYNVTLSLTNISENKSTYYKLQILKHDVIDRFIFYQCYGRVGNQNFREIINSFLTADSCIEAFELKFEAKTGNKWENRRNFVKCPGLMQILQTEFFGLDNGLVNNEVESNLEVEVQSLIREILDLETLKKRMMSLSININKLPLGMISISQLQNARLVLLKIFEIVRGKELSSRTDLVQANNEFYTLVPHTGPAVLLDTEIKVRKKFKLLNDLVKIEGAFEIMGCRYVRDPQHNTLDEQFRQLNADITLLDRDSPMFQLIELYVANTHAPTHNTYSLEIIHVFQVDRHEDRTRFEKNASMSNRRLLWHGTRTVNFASVIKDGLKIAPANAQHSGYMFGKGIYFADMVTKSANYCHHEETNGTGLLLLSEVALGTMWHLTAAFNVQQLEPTVNSVLGVGYYTPDPNGERFIDGCKVPCGKPLKTNQKTSLWYNEYVVYSPDQVKIKYIVKVRFDGSVQRF